MSGSTGLGPTTAVPEGGLSLGSSRWVVLDQTRIDTFADATEDRQWIHVDAARAADGPFGATIAHGYLTLSVAGSLLGELLEVGPGVTAVNYGLNRVRFLSPVRSGSSIRSTARVLGSTARVDARELTIAVTVDMQGETRPACVAQAIILLSADSIH